jgi:hypothetical protein
MSQEERDAERARVRRIVQQALHQDQGGEAGATSEVAGTSSIGATSTSASAAPVDPAPKVMGWGPDGCSLSSDIGPLDDDD